MLVDRQAHRRNAPEDLHRVSQYGQLHHLFSLELKPRTSVNQENQPRTLLLALVLDAKIKKEVTFGYEVTYYEGELSTGEVVDALTIQCAVGRILDRNRWWIVDRSSSLAYPEFV